MILRTLSLAALLCTTACTNPVDSDSDTDTDPQSDGYPWPRNPDKDELGDPDTTGKYPEVGAEIPRLVTRDQFGNEVDLYDFYEADRPVLIQLVYPDSREVSHDLGKLLAGKDGPLSDGPLSRLPEAVEDGDIWFIRVVGWSRLGSGIDPTYEDIEHWNSLYPQDGSPLLLDTDYRFYLYVTKFWVYNSPREIPEIIRVDPDTFRVSEVPLGSMDNVAAALGETE